MPEAFDPAWEYWEPDPETIEAMGSARTGTLDDLGVEGEFGQNPWSFRKGGKNCGFRLGRGNPDAGIIDPDPAPFQIGHPRESKRIIRLACAHCTRGFDSSDERQTYCRVCVPDRGRPRVQGAVCVQCGAAFRPRERRYTRFCSPACGSRYFKPVAHATGCPVCGNAFPPRGPKLYCSRRCKHIMLQRRGRLRAEEGEYA